MPLHLSLTFKKIRHIFTIHTAPGHLLILGLSSCRVHTSEDHAYHSSGIVQFHQLDWQFQDVALSRSQF